jgi:hypothetical protein
MNLSDLLINGVPLLIIVFGLVEFIKKLGVSGNALTVISMLIGVFLGICYQVSQLNTTFGLWFGIVAFGILIGLAASGIYSFANARFPSLVGEK